MGSKKGAQEAAKVVRSDLKELGLVLSEEKCQWDPVQHLEWCGFLWNLAEFRVKVPDDKVVRIKEMARSWWTVTLSLPDRQLRSQAWL